MPGALAPTVSSVMSDEELCTRVLRGDVDAFDVLYDRHAAYVNGVCFQFLRSREESEEVLQEIFLELWEGRLRYQSARGRLTTWLFCVAKNRCLNRLQVSARRRPHGPIPEELINPSGDDPEADAQVAQERSHVRRALAELPPEQRQAIEYCFFHSPNYREAAEALRIPSGTLKGRVRLAMRKLAETLKPQEGDK